MKYRSAIAIVFGALFLWESCMPSVVQAALSFWRPGLSLRHLLTTPSEATTAISTRRRLSATGGSSYAPTATSTVSRPDEIRRSQWIADVAVLGCLPVAKYGLNPAPSRGRIPSRNRWRIIQAALCGGLQVETTRCLRLVQHLGNANSALHRISDPSSEHRQADRGQDRDFALLEICVPWGIGWEHQRYGHFMAAVVLQTHHGVHGHHVSGHVA